MGRSPAPDIPTDAEVEHALDVIRRRMLAPPLIPPAPPVGERLLKIAQVAVRLAVSLRSAKRLIATGELPSQLVLRRRVERASDIDAYIERAGT